MEIYRVTTRNDPCLTHVNDNDNKFDFTSACKTIDAAQKLLRYPPNPHADVIIVLQVTGPIIYMSYDDAKGERKRYEEEVLIPYQCITHARLITAS